MGKPMPRALSCTVPPGHPRDFPGQEPPAQPSTVSCLLSIPLSTLGPNPHLDPQEAPAMAIRLRLVMPPEGLGYVEVTY